MTLWHVLMASYVSVNAGAAYANASKDEAGVAGHAIALAIGVGTGLCSALLVDNMAGKLLAQWARNHPEGVRERYYALIYVGAICGIPLSVFLASQAIAAAFRIL